MEDFLTRLRLQMEAGAARYMAFFRNENDRLNRENYAQPFLSCFCELCIERALDLNDGGTKYPSAHGAGCMGIATVADSLAAMEQVVFTQKKASLPELRDALAADFQGYSGPPGRPSPGPQVRQQRPPPRQIRRSGTWRSTPGFSTATAPPTAARSTPPWPPTSTTSPPGWRWPPPPTAGGTKAPLSDAASPMHGMDRKGPTAVVLSLTKPDYTLVSCGSVVNQKYSPSVFSDPEKRAKLRALLRVYFQKGGQEMQINAVSRAVLADAMDHPDELPLPGGPGLRLQRLLHHPGPRRPGRHPPAHRAGIVRPPPNHEVSYETSLSHPDSALFHRRRPRHPHHRLFQGLQSPLPLVP